MRRFTFSTVSLALSLAAFCSPFTHSICESVTMPACPAIALPSPPNPVWEPMTILQQQARDHSRQVDDVLDQISITAGPRG